MSSQLDTPHRTLDPRRRRQAIVALAALAFVMLGLISMAERPKSSISYGRSSLRAAPEGALPRETPTAEENADNSTPVVITVPVQVPVAVPAAGPVQRIAIPVESRPSVRGVVIEPRPANGPGAPEITRFYVDTEAPSAGEPTRFRWWAGDSDGQLRGYTVDFGDGREARNLGPDRCMTQPSDPVQERPPFDHVYEQPGRYTVVITVYSAGSCGNGPTQSASATLELDVGVFGVGAPVSAS